MKDENGRVERVLILAREVTEEVRARQRSEARAAELDAVLAAIADPMLVYGADGSLLRTNEAAFAAYSFDPAQAACGMTADWRLQADRFAIRHPNGMPVAVEDLPASRALQGERVINQPLLFANRRGEERLVLASAAPLVIAGARRGR